MRGPAGRFGGDPDALMTEGVRPSLGGGWARMLSDPDNPVFHVYAEPGDGEDPGRYPVELTVEYVDLVRSLSSKKAQETPQADIALQVETALY